MNFVSSLSPSKRIIGATGFAFLLTYVIPYLHIDEGNWAAMGQVLFSGEFYRQWSDNKPPFLMEWFWFLSIGARSMVALHLMSALWWALGACSLYRILCLVYSRENALIASVLAGILGATINYGAFSAELALTPFLIFATEIASRPPKNSKKNLSLALISGLLIGLACNIKPTAIILGVFPCILFLRWPRPLILAVAGLAGGILATLLTWTWVRAPFEAIYHEAFQINFQYMKFQNTQTVEAFKDVLTNVGVALGLAYISLSVGTIFAGAIFIRKLLQRGESRMKIVFGLILLALTYQTVSAGHRYFQQYFVAIIPCLAVFSCYSLENIKSKLLSRTLIVLGVASVIAFQGKLFYLQATDQNKNWNSGIEKVVADIQRDTTSEDRVWITNALGMIYHATHRKPAVKYYLFLHLIKFVEMCRASDDELKEDRQNAFYAESIDRVLKDPPKVIFWASKPENSCSDRLHLENFPTVRNLIDKRYERVWQSPLGVYYRLKPTPALQ